MNCVVTGGTGFIGKHLVKALKSDEQFQTVYVFDRKSSTHYTEVQERAGKRVVHVKLDVEHLDSLKHFFDNHKIDTIFHLAANPNVKESGRPTDISHTNIIGTHNLLACCQPDTHFVLASSATVYGDRCIGVYCDEISSTWPSSVYGATKLAAEALVEAHRRLGRISSTILRLVANVGPGATHGIFKDVLWKVQQEGDVLPLIGSRPGSRKPYCYVDDTVQAFLLAATKSEWKSEIVNISPEESISVCEFAEIVLSEYHEYGNKKIEFVEQTWAGDNLWVGVDNFKARNLGWKPICKTSEHAVRLAVRQCI